MTAEQIYTMGDQRIIDLDHGLVPEAESNNILVKILINIGKFDLLLLNLI